MLDKDKVGKGIFNEMEKMGVATGVLGDIGSEVTSDLVRFLDLSQIEPNPFQFRKIFEGIEDLAEDFKQRGVLVPILVCRKGQGYRLMAGERRWRAAKLAGLNTIPAIIKNVESHQIEEIGIVENCQRKSFKKIEEYYAIKYLSEKGYKQKDIAKMIGNKSETLISISLRAAELVDKAQSSGFSNYLEMASLFEEVRLQVIYEIAKVAEEDPGLAVDILKEIVSQGISGKAAENYVAVKINQAASSPVQPYSQVISKGDSGDSQTDSGNDNKNTQNDENFNMSKFSPGLKDGLGKSSLGDLPEFEPIPEPILEPEQKPAIEEEPIPTPDAGGTSAEAEPAERVHRVRLA